jgi:hypothetical protein
MTAKLSILKPKEYDQLCLTTPRRPNSTALAYCHFSLHMPATQIDLILEYWSSTELKQPLSITVPTQVSPRPKTI